MGTGTTITVFLADDSVIIREGVRAMLQREADLDVVGVAEDYDGLVQGAIATAPQVVVSDIRMPPNFQQEGIDGCKEIRKRHPGTGVVILSQYDDPDYAISLLSEGAAGYAYLLKDRIAEGDQLARAIREVATDGSMLDPAIVDALVNPVTLGRGALARGRGAPDDGGRGQADQGDRRREAHHPGRGRRRGRAPVRALAAGRRAAADGALKRRPRGCTRRSSSGRSRARRWPACCPAGLAEKLRHGGPPHRGDRAARSSRS